MGLPSSLPFSTSSPPLVGCCLALKESFHLSPSYTALEVQMFQLEHLLSWLILTDTSQCLLLMIVLQKLNWLECNSPCLTSASGQYFSWKLQLEQSVIFKKDCIFLFTSSFLFSLTPEDFVSSVLKCSYFYVAIISFQTCFSLLNMHLLQCYSNPSLDTSWGNLFSPKQSIRNTFFRMISQISLFVAKTGRGTSAV